MRLASVAGLFLTRVKGFGMAQIESFDVGIGGVIGDRDYFLVDAAGQLYSATRSGAFLPWHASFDGHGRRVTFSTDEGSRVSFDLTPGPHLRSHFYEDRYVHGTVMGGDVGMWLSDIAGRPLRLVRCKASNGGVDIQPITLVTRATVSALGVDADGSVIDPRRFRMNLLLDGGEPFAEEEWAGYDVVIGGARLRIAGPVPRCAAVQRRPGYGDRTVNVLRRIRDTRRPTLDHSGAPPELCVYATVLQPGTVHRDDVVTMGESN